MAEPTSQNPLYLDKEMLRQLAARADRNGDGEMTPAEAKQFGDEVKGELTKGLAGIKENIKSINDGDIKTIITQSGLSPTPENIAKFRAEITDPKTIDKIISDASGVIPEALAATLEASGIKATPEAIAAFKTSISTGGDIASQTTVTKSSTTTTSDADKEEAERKQKTSESKKKGPFDDLMELFKVIMTALGFMDKDPHKQDNQPAEQQTIVAKKDSASVDAAGLDPSVKAQIDRERREFRKMEVAYSNSPEAATVQVQAGGGIKQESAAVGPA